jgi:hypothetical protein
LPARYIPASHNDVAHNEGTARSTLFRARLT